MYCTRDYWCCTEPGGKGDKRKWVVRELGGVEDRWPRSSSGWSNNKQNRKLLFQATVRAAQHHSFLFTLQWGEKHWHNQHRVLAVDWRKTSVEIGVENILMKTWKGEGCNPPRYRGYISVPGTGLSFRSFPSLPLSVKCYFLSLLEGEHRWEPLDLCGSSGNC